MLLKFLGNGSGFTTSHNNAYFEKDGNIYFIDLSMLNLEKALKLQPEKYDNIFIIITHMHEDHTTGIGLFIQHMFYTKQKKVFLIAPYKLQLDIAVDLVYIRGIDSEAFEVVTPDKMKERFGFEIEAINTKHVPELIDKCFGYVFELQETRIVYTGDTCNLYDFKPYLTDGCEFYVDVSMNYGKVHLLFSDIKDELIKLSERMSVCLMHIDNMEKAKEAVEDNNLQIAQLAII